MSEFFDDVNEYFFNPLTGSNRQLYLNCINQLITCSEHVSELHESDAVNELTWYFRNIAVKNIAVKVSDDQESDVLASNEPQKNARKVLEYFRKCGWVSKAEMDRNGDNFAMVTSMCRNVIYRINDILKERDSAESVANYVRQMYDRLNAFQTAGEDDPSRQQPYRDLLQPLIADMQQCEERLREFKETEHEVMQAVMASYNTRELIGLWESNKKQDEMFKAYNNIKNNGVAEHYLAKAADMMDQILTGKTRSDIIENYQLVKHVDDPSEAEQEVDVQIETLIAFTDVGYKDLIRSIDKEHTEYWNLFSGRLNAVRRMGTEGRDLNALLMRLKEMDEDDRNYTLDKLQDAWHVSKIQCMGIDVMKKPRTSERGKPSAELIGIERDKEALEKQADDFLDSMSSEYSRKHVRKYMKGMLKGKDEVTSQEDVMTRQDMIMLLLHASMEDDPSERERIIIKSGTVSTPIGEMSNIVYKEVSNETKED